MEISELNSKRLAYYNLQSCLCLSATFFLLYSSGNLYNIGKAQTKQVEIVLVTTELLKFLKYYVYQGNGKRPDVKRFKIKNIFKGISTIASMIAAFYIVAVLFGAPVFGSQYQTLSFAVLLAVLTVVPCCLYLGPDSVFTLFTSLTSFEGSDIYRKFLLNIRLTIFGAWLGAVLIPLDWNKPYQEWPVPCCLGALIGCFLSHFISLVLYLFSVPTKKSGKFHL